MNFPIKNLIDEISSYENVSQSFDYVVRNLEHVEQREYYRPRRERIVTELMRELRNGSFRIYIDEVRTIRVKDGPKARDVQAPPVYKRIGGNAIMVVVEKYVYPTLITNTAASIKNRGMHWLHHRIEEDMRNAPNDWVYYYQNDIRHYYESIDQDIMAEVIRKYIADEVLLPMLDCFIRLMPTGLSKGLRSSQCFANLYLSPVHHRMLQEVSRYALRHDNGDVEQRYLYYNYCDDTVFASSSKKELWRLRDIYVEEVAKLGLKVKPTEAVRPLSEGLDFLGFKNFGSHALIRKRIKKKAARALHRVKSRKRRGQIIGSFKGMACHADCKNLFYKLTNQRMRKFSELGITYIPADGKKRFAGKVVPLSGLVNRPIEVHDYEVDVKTQHGDNRYLVSIRCIDSGDWCKFFTASEELKSYLSQAASMTDALPFETVIKQEIYDGGKRIYTFT